MAGSVFIRRSLMTNLVWLIVLLSGATILTTVVGARRAVRTLSRSLISRTIDQTEAELGRFFDPVQTQLQLARSWGEAGLLDPQQTDHMNRLLVPLANDYPQISSLMVADGRGREHMVLLTGGKWFVRQTRRDEWDDRTR